MEIYRNLFELIVSAQNKDTDALEQLVIKFMPLLKKYATLLETEDALQELQVNFIVLLLKMKPECLRGKEDKYIVSYLKKSVYNDYICLSKSNRKYRRTHWFECDMKQEVIACVDKQTAVYNQYNGLLQDELKRLLTGVEYEVICLHYIFNYHIGEIATMKKVSKQTENKTKNRALAKIRIQFGEGYQS